MPTYIPILDAEVAAEQPVTVSLMTRLRDNALTYAGAPTGTRALWHQTAAPLGWTKDVAAGTHDRAIRLTTGTVGVGGSSPFSTVFGKTGTDGTALALDQLPVHNLTHNLDLNNTALIGSVTSLGLSISENLTSPDVRYRAQTSAKYVRSSSAADFELLEIWNGGAGSDVIAQLDHNHAGSTLTSGVVGGTVTDGSVTGTVSLGGSGNAHAHPIDIRVHYTDVIVAVKD